MNYEDEYIKYKTKYLKLQNTYNRASGNSSGEKKSNIIIHISGPSGAGKTTIGNKLKKFFGSKIVVKDMDNLRSKFINKTYGKKFEWNMFESDRYQKFIDKFLHKQSKPVVIVGLNHMFWHDEELYYDLHSKYNFYIKIDDMVVVQQKCIRFITRELQRIIKNKNVISDITHDNNKFVKLVSENIERECGMNETIKINKMWNTDYKNQGYKFMTRENIFNTCVNILTHVLHT